MAIKFFGQFLLEKNIIKPEQLIEALEYQETKNLKFGEYALSKGYISEKDFELFHNEQKRFDLMMGEIAEKLNILTREQIEEILTMQSNDHIFIGEALVRQDVLSRNALEKELALFKEEQSRYATDKIITPTGIENPETVNDMVDLSQKMFKRMVNLNTKIGKGFISRDEPEKNYLLISTSIYGKFKYEYVLSSSSEIAKLIASAVIGGDIKNNSREIISDGVKEFCNIVCGNVIAKLAQKGKSLDIKPPEEIVCSDDGYHLVNGRKAIYYPLISPEGESTLILIEGQDNK